MTNSGHEISYSPAGTRDIYYRLITLWVLNEAMLGGIIHGLKIPVSGLVVGSCAIICICLIGWYVPGKGSIIKATIIVAIFKMVLSPQAPPPAYIAVFFQGLLGELLFRNRKFYRVSCLLLAVLGLLESGLQRILVLTIIYGNDLWKVINDFINGLTKQKITTNYSLLIGAGYVLLHLVTGLVVGWWASVLPKSIERWRLEERNKIISISGDAVAQGPRTKRKKRLKTGLLIVWIILILLYVQSEFSIGTPLLPSHISMKILIRSLIIILAWVFIVGPLLRQLLHYWLQKKRARSGQDIRRVMQLLPGMQQLIAQSWRTSADKKGWERIKSFTRIVLVNSLSPDLPPSKKRNQIFILTGAIQTGKTTSLINWSEKRNDVFGILTPVVNQKRMFMDAHTREQFPMEAGEEETRVLTVGKYVFSKTNFEKAIAIIRGSMQKEGWLVIDEIGPLELRGEGYSEILKEALAGVNHNQNILLVVREGMVEKVTVFFGLDNFILISDPSALLK